MKVFLHVPIPWKTLFIFWGIFTALKILLFHA